jgi:hypothetical protein
VEAFFPGGIFSHDGFVTPEENEETNPEAQPHHEAQPAAHANCDAV